jgi:hypothetical protein
MKKGHKRGPGGLTLLRKTWSSGVGGATFKLAKESAGEFELTDAKELDKQFKDVSDNDLSLLEEVFKVVKDKNDFIDWVSVGVTDMYPYWNHLGSVKLKDPNAEPIIEVEGSRVTDLSPLAEPSSDGGAVIAKIKNCRFDASCCMLLSDRSAIPANQRFVLVAEMNDNWGYLSSHVSNRTINWGNYDQNLKACGKTESDVFDFLNDPRLVLLLVMTHQHIAHEKILSIPLGMHEIGGDRLRSEEVLWQVGHEILKNKAKFKKQRLLFLNMGVKGDGLAHRRGIIKMLEGRFGVTNTYQRGKNRATHYHDLAESKFVLCAGGLGTDTYRHWETLSLGSIPVMEHSPGLDRTYSGLPVVFVKSYEDVTPMLLETAYKLIVNNHKRWDYSRVTQGYWKKLVNDAVAAKSAENIQDAHPLVQGTISAFGK